jgi:hypothetical protein
MKYLKWVVLFLIVVIALAIWYVAEAPKAVSDLPDQLENNASTTDGAAEAPKAEVKSEPAVTPTPAQVKVLETVGLSAETLSFTESEIACFKDVLGEERVNEIIGGAVPGPVELYKAKACLQ